MARIEQWGTHGPVQEIPAGPARGSVRRYRGSYGFRLTCCGEELIRLEQAVPGRGSGYSCRCPRCGEWCHTAAAGDQLEVRPGQRPKP